MERQEAPGELELVRAFVNTLNVEAGTDEFADPSALARWLRRRGLSSTRTASPADVVAARRLREAIRALLLENNGVSVRKEAALTLNRTGERARLRLVFDPQGRATLEPGARGVDGALGRVLAIVADAMVDGTWGRLKACRADGCRWAFYDHARNRSRHWCSMAVCGNRTKAREYRRRHVRG
ncbi:MAG TPA: CGNR zinc finger domain-containing protein [Gaiellaceae bacterium]|nr:CGNR zinc finger domain-containing protein [Gaiellaceae bacterium]